MLRASARLTVLASRAVRGQTSVRRVLATRPGVVVAPTSPALSLVQPLKPVTRHHAPTALVVRSASTLALPTHPTHSSSSTPRAWSLRDIALYSGVLGVGTVVAQLLRFPEQSVPPATIEVPGEFTHPLSTTSTINKAFVVAKRCAWLALLFVPCAAMGLVARLTNSDRLHDLFLSALVRSFELAGCGFQKFGQWMSMRPDMFPRDVVEAMSKLRQDAPKHHFRHTRAMVRESFGCEIEELFESFDEEPVASGTVAQVHRAVLRPEHAIDGQHREVAVKVRHPSVLEETFVDVDLIFRFMDNSTILTVPFNKTHFMESLQKQINFEWEGYALSCFARNFRKEMDKGEVHFPTVSKELLSPSVLVESWVPGNTVADFFSEVGDGFKELASDVSSAVQAQRERMAEQLFAVCMKMFLRDNLMHGDLHSGNVLYNKQSGVVTVLDAGHTTSLTSESASHFGSFMTGMCKGNPDLIVSALLAFSDTPAKDVDQEGLRADVAEACRRHVRADGRGPDGRPACVGDLMGEILFKLNARHVALRGDVAISLVSIAVSEGLIRQLSPEFDMNLRALPYIAKYSRQAALAC